MMTTVEHVETDDQWGSSVVDWDSLCKDRTARCALGGSGLALPPAKPAAGWLAAGAGCEDTDEVAPVRLVECPHPATEALARHLAPGEKRQLLFWRPRLLRSCKTCWPQWEDVAPCSSCSTLLRRGLPNAQDHVVFVSHRWVHAAASRSEPYHVLMKCASQVDRGLPGLAGAGDGLLFLHDFSVPNLPPSDALLEGHDDQEGLASWAKRRAATAVARELAVLALRADSIAVAGSPGSATKDFNYMDAMEWFVASVKLAMLGEDITWSVLAEAESGMRWAVGAAARLRDGAAQGPHALRSALHTLAASLKPTRTSQRVAAAVAVGPAGCRPCAPRAARPPEVAPEPVPPAGGGQGEPGPGWLEAADESVQQLLRELASPEAWAAEAARQCDRALLVAAGRGDAAACRALLGRGASPEVQLPDGRHCLHLAAAVHAEEVAALLVAARADTRSCDTLGNIPAHYVKLMAVTETLSLFDTLAPSGRHLLRLNAAGVTPLQRFSAWSTVCRESRPYLEAVDHSNFLRSRFPDLRPVATIATASGRLDAAPILSNDVIVTHVRSCATRLYTWESVDIPLVTVAVLPFSGLFPWNVHRRTVDALAQQLCLRHRVRLVAFRSDVVPFVSATTWESFHEEARAVLLAFPWQTPLVVMCSHAGAALPLLWSLPRLAGALVLNCSYCREETFRGSHAFETAMASDERRLGCVRAHRGDLLVLHELPHAVFTHSCEELIDIETSMTQTYSIAPDAFWKSAAQSITWTPELLGRFQALTRLHLPKVVIACGVFAEPAIHMSSLRLLALMPGAELRYIPDSRTAWELEGADQQRFVACLLHDVLLAVEPLADGGQSPPHTANVAGLGRPEGDCTSNIAGEVDVISDDSYGSQGV